jgi:hypothetical protein
MMAGCLKGELTCVETSGVAPWERTAQRRESARREAKKVRTDAEGHMRR